MALKRPALFFRSSAAAPSFNCAQKARIRQISFFSRMANIPSFKLNDGNTIPALAYGTGTAWFKRGQDDPFDESLVSSLKSAIGLGYYHLDGAEVYRTEGELGKAIKESGVAREKLFVTTKLHPKTTDNIPAAFEGSLKRLGLDYVDLYLIHAPFSLTTPSSFQSAWAAMESIHKSGKARSIGVSNLLPSQLEYILQTATIVPAINQVEWHPYLQHVGEGSLASDGTDFVSFHQKHGIMLASYGPLTPVTRASGGPVDPVLEKLAKKYSVGPGAVLLRWAIDRGLAVVTTSSKEERMKEYLDATKFSLEKEEVDEITKLGKQKHYRAFWKDKFAADDRT